MNKYFRTVRTSSLSVHARLAFRRSRSTWAQDTADRSNTVQSYVSTTNDPFINLSIEHYLLENAPRYSSVLFLYINRPCVVIGRNQNPFIEVDLAAVSNTSENVGKVDLVRRRSGGGTVFHDEGNVNWTIISPADTFTRDKHAEMIVRALRGRGIERARVNTRHDIVLDQGLQRGASDPNDLHRTCFSVDDGSTKPLKVSGSAYKLTRGRALHHGTCLLDSTRLESISKMLRSPARDYITAKGVGSVSSPVGKIGLSTENFKHAVQHEFGKMYGTSRAGVIEVGEDALEIPGVAQGNDELHTLEWLWDQTPSFSLSSQPTTDDRDGRKPSLELPSNTRVFMEFRHAQCTAASLSLSADANEATAQANRSSHVLKGEFLRNIRSWQDIITTMDLTTDLRTRNQVVQWLQTMLPTPL